jgi:hypothetical protein
MMTRFLPKWAGCLLSEGTYFVRTWGACQLSKAPNSLSHGRHIPVDYREYTRVEKQGVLLANNDFETPVLLLSTTLLGSDMGRREWPRRVEEGK